MDFTQQDYQKLMSAVLRQAMDDYTKMLHPNCRKRKYEQEAFWSARDLLWDDECELAIDDDEGNPMTLEKVAMVAADRENVDLKKLRSYLITETNNYWNEKQVKTIALPDDVIVEGYTYSVQQSEEPNIDFDNRIIYMNKLSPTAEEDFVLTLMELSCHHGEIRTTGKIRKDLSKIFYRILRINNCFVGDS